MANRSDDFMRADSSVSLDPPSDGGSSWVYLLGVWGVNSNSGYNPGSEHYSAAALECGEADGDVVCTLTARGANPAISFRGSDSNNYWLAFLTNFSIKFVQVVAGVPADVGPTYGGTSADGDVIQVTMAGSSLQLFQNGVLRVAVTDAFNQTATQHGLGGYSSGDTLFNAWSFTGAAPSGGLLVNNNLTGGMQTLPGKNV